MRRWVPRITTAGPFDPQTQGTLVNWYDASTLGLPNGTTVATWTDSKTGNPNPMSATTQAGVYATNQQNGLGTVGWVGGTAFYDTGGSSASTYPRTYAVVFTRPNATVQYTMVGSSGSGGLQLRCDITTGNVSWVKTGVAIIGTSTSTVGNNAYHVLISTIDSSSYAHYIDGVAAGSGSHSTTLTGGLTVHLGGTSTGSEIQIFNGNIGEVQIYSSVLSAGDITGCYNYLKAKWATP